MLKHRVIIVFALFRILEGRLESRQLSTSLIVLMNNKIQVIVTRIVIINCLLIIYFIIIVV